MDEKEKFTRKKYEMSKGGVRMYAYTIEDFLESQDAIENIENIKLITKHIEKHIGKPEIVFHEIGSKDVHIEIFLIPPSENRDYATLVTSGMSDKPMAIPDKEFQDCRYAELVMQIPEEWMFLEAVEEGQTEPWPVKALRDLAHFPHTLNTWLWCGHTISNFEGDIPVPFAKDTRLNSSILLDPILFFGEEFITLPVNEEKIINFFSVALLYPEERQWKLDHGTASLIDKSFETDINLYYVHPYRENIVTGE